MVVCGEPVSDGDVFSAKVSRPRPRLTDPVLCRLLFSPARGRDEEEEGGAHRPGDHELGESVSGLVMKPEKTLDKTLQVAALLQKTKSQNVTYLCSFIRFVDVLKLLHIVSIPFI